MTTVEIIPKPTDWVPPKEHTSGVVNNVSLQSDWIEFDQASYNRLALIRSIEQSIAGIMGGIRIDFHLADVRQSISDFKLKIDGAYTGSNKDIAIYVLNRVNDEYEQLAVMHGGDIEVDSYSLKGDLDEYLTEDNIITFVMQPIQTEAQSGKIDINHVGMTVFGSALRNPMVIQTFLNLLENPSVEEYIDGKFAGWNDINSVWEPDFIHFFHGGKSAKTYRLNQPLYQDVYCQPGEYLTVLWAAKSDNGRDVRVTLEYLNSSDVKIDSYSQTVTTQKEYQEFWFSTPEPTPEGTRKVRFKVEKVSGTQSNTDYVYVDQFLLQLGASEQRPTWSNMGRKYIKYHGDLYDEDVLKINLGTKAATVNGLDNVYSQIEGDMFSLPVGRFMLIVTDDEDSSHTGEVIVRYDEVWT